MTFFHTLQDRTAAERDHLLTAPVLQLAVDGKLSLETYIAFLTQAYHHVKHTVPLLMACGARLPERLEWLRSAIAEYIEEELGHQEWILNDLAACGADPEAVRHGQPALATELMVAYVYDRIARHNPVSFFGVVTALALRGDGLLPELVDPVSLNWYGALPAIGSGAAEYVLTAEVIARMRSGAFDR